MSRRWQIYLLTSKSMDIEITFDPKYGYSASIHKINTHTQGKTWDKLMFNINEAI